MASNDLDVPHVALGGERPTLGASSATSATNSFKFPPLLIGRTSDVHDFLSIPPPVLRNYLNPLDVPTSPTLHISGPSLHSPPSLTLSAHSSSPNRWAASPVLRNDNLEKNDGISPLGLLTPLSQVHHGKVCAGTISSIDRDYGSSSLGRSGISDVPSILPSPTNTHVDAGLETSHSSLATSFFKRTVQSIRHPSPSPSSEIDISSDTTQEAGLNVEPFAFRPLQLVNLVKNLENLEGLGGIEGLLFGLGTNRLYGLSTKLTQSTSHDPEFINAVHSDCEETTPPKPDMIASPLDVPEGLLRTAHLGGGSITDYPASLKFLARAYKATITDRQRVYGQNILPRRPTKNLLLLMWLALQDKAIVLLSIAAVVSFALGLFQDFGTTRSQGEPPVDWVEGVSIIVAILIVAAAGSLNDWQKERQFQALDEKKEDRFIKVIRDGEERQINVRQVVVGDVVLLEPGEVAPCDGVFLSGHNVRCDESSTTGESDPIKKLSYEECVALRDQQLMVFDPDSPPSGGRSVNASQRKTGPSGLELLGNTDCFIVSGSKVLEGVGSYVVTSVGTKSFNGRITMALERDSENTPLQLKLNDLSEIIAKIGRIAGGLLFAALLVRYFIQLASNNLQRTSSEKGIALVNILIITATFVVVAVPKGLPLAVTHALAFALKQISKQNLLLRTLGSCGTMAYASVICTDKTGTLTQSGMTVVGVSVGVHAKFVRRLEENRGRTGSDARSDPNATYFDINLANLNTVLPDPLKDLFNAAIAINSTAFEVMHAENGAPVFIGSKTEAALLGFAKELGWPSYKHTRDSAAIVQMLPFSSHRKSMGCVVRLADGSHRLYVKGASEVLAQKCTRHVVAYCDPANDAPSGNEVETAPIGETEEDNISRTIAFYSSQALLTISLCYRDFPYWPPHGARLLDKGEVDYDDLMTNLTLICVAAIKNPLRAGVREAVADCGKAGVHVKMCTGDNALTARSIARQCGIYTPGGIVMEGSHFRTLSPGVMKAIVPRLQVLARSSPEDKRMLVKTLKELGEVVGVIGDGTDDGPDNLSSIVNGIMWGRCVNDSVRKCLQFQISTHFTTVVVMIVWALASSSDKPMLGAVQLLWISIIMGTFAPLALTTDLASPVLFNRNPDKKTDPLFTVNMIKQILGQVVYQIVITLFLHFLGSRVLGFHHTDDPTLQKHHNDIVQTLVFNTFVFAQIFNSFNCRRLDRKLNVFEDVSKNRYFMVITTIEVAVQVLICFVGGAAFDVTRMGVREWCTSVGLGCASLPLGALIRLIPNEPCERAFKKLKLLLEPELLPTTCPDAEPGFSFAVDQMRNNLGTFAQLHGGRMRGSSFVRPSRSVPPDPDGRRPLPGLSAMVPSPDISYVATPEWQPGTSGSLSDPVGFGSLGSSAALWENGFEVHPDTPWDDPVYGLLGVIRRPVTTR